MSFTASESVSRLLLLCNLVAIDRMAALKYASFMPLSIPFPPELLLVPEPEDVRFPLLPELPPLVLLLVGVSWAWSTDCWMFSASPLEMPAASNVELSGIIPASSMVIARL